MGSSPFARFHFGLGRGALAQTAVAGGCLPRRTSRRGLVALRVGAGTARLSEGGASGRPCREGQCQRAAHSLMGASAVRWGSTSFELEEREARRDS